MELEKDVKSVTIETFWDGNAYRAKLRFDNAWERLSDAHPDVYEVMLHALRRAENQLKHDQWIANYVEEADRASGGLMDLPQFRVVTRELYETEGHQDPVYLARERYSQ